MLWLKRENGKGRGRPNSCLKVITYRNPSEGVKKLAEAISR